MSEVINNSKERLDKLVDFSKKLIDGGNGKELIEQYNLYTESVTAVETMQVFDKLLARGYSIKLVKSFAGKLVNVFYKSLNNAEWNGPGENHFLNYLMQENRGVEEIMNAIKHILKHTGKEVSIKQKFVDELLELINRLRAYEKHYLKKENILFPFIENTFPQYRCLKIMWSFHDDFRNKIKQLEVLLKSENPDNQRINTEFGRLFFVVLPIIFREEKIVFPVAERAIPDNEWNKMLVQSVDIGWCYNVNPEIPEDIIKDSKEISFDKVNLGTGLLSAEQLILLFKNLPVDITYVDEQDEVCYFSEGERIFPRSNAIIGRKVQNCHPPESVHIVEEIITAFKNGSKSHADFWIKMNNRFIYIRYFALRDDSDIYRGTIEVSQDITEIKKLKGEQRLLDWTD